MMKKNRCNKLARLVNSRYSTLLRILRNKAGARKERESESEREREREREVLLTITR
jgi:hypothetical protein